MLKSCSGARSILIRAEAEVAVPVYRGEGISPHHSWDRSREAMRGDEKKDEKKGGGEGARRGASSARCVTRRKHIHQPRRLI